MVFVGTIVNLAAHHPIASWHIHHGAALECINAFHPGVSVATLPQPLATEQCTPNGVLLPILFLWALGARLLLLHLHLLLNLALVLL